MTTTALLVMIEDYKTSLNWPEATVLISSIIIDVRVYHKAWQWALPSFQVHHVDIFLSLELLCIYSATEVL